MAQRDTLQIGDPRLKAKNAGVTDFKSTSIKQLVKDLTDTMRVNQLIGMAAPQIGENYTVFVTEPRKTKTRSADQADELRVFINPNIVFFSKEQTLIYEGCGSVCHGQLFGPVIRPKEITVAAYNEAGNKFTFTCDGILARVIQHEYDHLSGIEFTEKISDYKKLLSVDAYIQSIKNSKEQTQASRITKKEFSYI